MNLNKKAFIILLYLAICSCGTNIPPNTTNKDITTNNLSVQTRTTIKGKAEFPVSGLLTPSPSQTSPVLQTPPSKGDFREGGNSSHSTVNSSPPLTKGFGGFSSSSPFTTKATITEVGSNATVSIITPSEASTPNKTIATGLTDNSGNFTIDPSTSFNPAVNEIFVLEATRRIGGSGQSLMSIRTYIKWTESGWISMTKNFNDNTYPIYINTKTTALSLIAAINADILPAHTIGTINIAGGSSVPSTITGDNSYILDAQVIIDTAQNIEILIGSNLDPTHIIKYDSILNKYTPSRSENPQKLFLINTKNCPNCSLFGEDLSNSDLSNGDLTKTDLTGTKLTGATLTGANVTEANFSNVNMTSIKGYNGNANDFTNFDFSNANLSNTTLTGTTLTGATLTGSTLTGAKVTGTNFSNVNMTGIKGYNGIANNFTNFDFSNASLTGATLTGATMTGTNLSNVNMTSIKGTYGVVNNFNTFNFSNANLSNTIFTGAYLQGTNFTGATMTGTTITGTSLLGVNFSNVNMTGIKGYNGIANNFTNFDFSSAILTGVTLTGATMTGTNLSNVNMTSIKAYNAITNDFRAFNFSNANLSNTIFTGANLSGATFTGATMTGTTLSTYLSSANLSNVNMTSIKGHNGIANNFTNFNFSFANLSGANLTGANLNIADLDYANLTGANLTGANLTGANLSGATWTDGHRCKTDYLFDGLCD